MTRSAQLLEDSLLLIWNNRDAAERLDLMKKAYDDRIEFYEGDGSEPIVGYEDINALITKLQENWAPDFKFIPQKPAMVNHDVQYATWTLGADGAAPVASGADVAWIQGGKIKTLHLFLNKD